MARKEYQDLIDEISALKDKILSLRDEEKTGALASDISQLLLNQAGIGLGYFDLAGNCLMMNQTACALMGVSAQNVVGKNIQELSGAADGGEHLARFLDIIQSGDTKVYEDQATLSGGDKWFLSRYSQIVNADNTPAGVLIHALEITEQKKLESNLVENEILFQTLAETSSDAIYLLNSKGTVIRTNPAAANMLGYSQNEINVLSIDKIDPNYPLQDFLAFWENVSEHYSVLFETTHQRKDGTFFPAEVHGSKFKVGGEMFYYGIARDISSRKETEEQTEKLLHQLEESERIAQVGSWDWNLVTNETIWSAELYRICGRDPKDGVPTEEHYLENIHPDDRDPLQVAINESFISGEYHCQYRLIRYDDGSERVISAHGEVQFDDQGNPVRQVGTARDITRFLKAEESLRENERRLSTLMNNLPGMAFRCIKDENWTMLFVSEGSNRLSGYQPSELVDNHLVAYNSIIHPDERQFVRGTIDAALKNNTYFEITYRIVTKEGQEKWVWEKGQKEPSQPGEPEILEGIILDITDQVKAQNSLEISEARFREIFENNASGIAIYSSENGEDFFFTDINPVGARNGGLSHEEYIGKSVREVYPGIEELGLFKIFQQVWREGGTIHHPISQYQDDRIEQWVENTVTRLPSGQIMAVYEETTARHRAEEQVQYQVKLLANVSDAVISSDTNFRIKSWNKAAEILYGWEEEEVLGREYKNIVNARYLNTSWEELFEEFYQNGVWKGEAIHRTKSGEELFIQTSVSAIHDLNGKQIGSVSINRDISELKNREIELIESAARLKFLHNLDTAFLESQSLKEIAQNAANFVKSHQKCLQVGVALLDIQKGKFELLVTSGPSDSIKQALSKEIFEQFNKVISPESLGQIIAFDDIDMTGKIAQKFAQVGAKRLLVVPMAIEKQLFGLITLTYNQYAELKREEEILIKQIANQLAIVIRHTDLFNQLESNSESMQAMAKKVITAQEDERRVIARELHDEAGQTLTALKIDLELLKADLPESSKGISDRLEEAIEMADLLHENLRSLAHGLRPAALDTLGLLPSLETMCEDFKLRTGISVSFEKPKTLTLPEIQQITLYRVIQESMTNIARHANATEARIIIEKADNQLQVSIVDNGVGFSEDEISSDPSARKGIGLSSMIERFKIVGGKLSVKSKPGSGTRVTGKFPMD